MSTKKASCSTHGEKLGSPSRSFLITITGGIDIAVRKYCTKKKSAQNIYC